MRVICFNMTDVQEGDVGKTGRKYEDMTRIYVGHMSPCTV
jgi:hypothetical protein